MRNLIGNSLVRAVALPCAALVLSCGAVSAETIQISQPGDGAMTCPQLAAEVGRMDQIVNDAEKAKSDAESSGRAANVAGSVAKSAAAYSGVLGSVPGLGFLGSAVEGAVKDNAEAEARQQEQTVQNAQMRRVALMGIYQGKGCLTAAPTPVPATTTQSAGAAGVTPAVATAGEAVASPPGGNPSPAAAEAAPPTE